MAAVVSMRSTATFRPDGSSKVGLWPGCSPRSSGGSPILSVSGRTSRVFMKSRMSSRSPGRPSVCRLYQLPRVHFIPLAAPLPPLRPLLGRRGQAAPTPQVGWKGSPSPRRARGPRRIPGNRGSRRAAIAIGSALAIPARNTLIGPRRETSLWPTKRTSVTAPRKTPGPIAPKASVPPGQPRRTQRTSSSQRPRLA
jgi:hypothetical protein